MTTSSNTHPATASSTPTETTAGTPVATPETVSPAATPGTPVTGSRVSTIVDIVLAAFQPLEARIQAALEPQPTGQRVGSVNNTHETAAPRVATLVRNHTSLAAVCDAAAVDRCIQDLVSGRQAAARLRTLANLLEYNGKLSFDTGWVQCRMAISMAEHIARKEDAMNTDLGPVREALARGKRTTATAQQADAAARSATAAQGRAAKAQQRATKAQRVATRAAQAHADQHPTQSPVPEANPQGPAASANVNPQGPAPGR